MIKNLVNYQDKSIDDIIIFLADNDYALMSWLYDFVSNPDAIWVVQALAKIGIRGNDIKKFIQHSCGNDAVNLMTSLQMLASDAYFDSEVSENMDREKPFPFFDREMETDDMIEALGNMMVPTDSELFKELCVRQRKYYRYKYGSPESSNPVLMRWMMARGRHH